MTNPSGPGRAIVPEPKQLVALPTEFEGHAYKSRGEARFAVFFKTLGLPYEYEPEGFELSDGTWYLPDFYLPTIRTWAECKPSFLFPDEENKCRLLSQGTGFPCLFLIGPPDFVAYEGATWDCGEYTAVPYSLDIDAHWQIYQKEHRLFGQPDYRTPPDETQFRAPYRHAIYASRGYKFEGVR